MGHRARSSRAGLLESQFSSVADLPELATKQRVRLAPLQARKLKLSLCAGKHADDNFLTRLTAAETSHFATEV